MYVYTITFSSEAEKFAMTYSIHTLKLRSLYSYSFHRIFQVNPKEVCHDVVMSYNKKLLRLCQKFFLAPC